MPATDTIPAPPKGFVLDDEGDVPPPPKGFALDLSPQEASSAMDRVTRPQSPVSAAPSSARYSWKTSPQRSTAEGLVSEEQERRGGMPFEIQPTSGSLESPHPARAVATPRANAVLSPAAQPNVDVQEPDAVPVPVGPKFVNPGKATPAEAAADVENLKTITGYRGYGEIKKGMEEALPTSLQPNPSLKQAEVGATDILKGATTAATPLMAAGAIAQPELTVAALLGGTGGQYGAGKLADVIKTSPETKELLEQVGGLVGGMAGAGAHAGLKAAVDPTDALTDLLWRRGYVQDKSGQPIHISSQGEARAVAEEMIKQNPQGFVQSIRNGYSWSKAAQNVPARRSMGVAEPAGMPLGLPGEVPPVQATAPPQSPAPPPVEPMHSITSEEIAEVGDKIAALPTEQRPQATLAAHTSLSAELLKQGKLITPDGKLQIITNQKQAESLAQKLINEEIGRQDAQAKQSAKEPVPAPPPGFTIEETPAETKPPAFQKGDRVTLPKGDTGTIAHMNSRLIRVTLDSGGKASVPAEQWGKVQKVQSENAGATQPTSERGVPARTAPPNGVPNGDTSGDSVRVEPGVAENPRGVSGVPVSGAASNAVEQSAASDVGKGQIIFARHGETKLDQAGANETVAGWTQEPLDDRGRKAAAKLADDIEDQKPTVIVTSDLARAKQTAEIVGKQLGIPVREDSRLRPQHVPETEGLKVGAATPIWNSYEQNPDKKPEGGESWHEAEARQDAALKDVEALVAKGERPVVLTHSRNLEMELGERPKPGGFITRNGREKGGATEPTKGVESGNGQTHLPANDRSDTGSAPAGTAAGASGTNGNSGESPARLGQGAPASGEGVSGGSVSERGAGAVEENPKYKFGSTQANIPSESEAAKALEAARARISKADLMPTGFGGDQTTGLEDHPHITVRYGLKGDDFEGIRNYLKAQTPFEASLGKMASFPASEHSDGAAPIIAPVNAPELHRIESELDKHGDFSERSFPEYKPHATVAYVKPEAAHKYVGDATTAGKKFTVSEIAISKKDGSQEVVKLEGRKAEARRESWRSPRIASDIENWQAPPELGVTHAPDYGQNVRAETEKKMGGPLTRSSVEVAPGKVGEMKVSDLKVAPAKFQYKLSTDAEGVGTLLKETKVWNPDLAGIISVWRDPADGKTYVVNGHHRYELAKRLGVDAVTVRHIVAKNATQARSIGAMQNIAEGRGTAMDAAKFFRDSGKAAEHLEQEGISLGEKTASDGLAMSRLDPSIFAKVVSGDLRQGRAIAIGEATADPAEQKAILSLVEKKERGGAKVSDATLSELIRLVKGSEQTTETTANLFGTQEITRSLALEKAEISAHIKQQLAKDKKLFGFVSKGDRATELQRGGNTIDVEKSKEISTGAAQAEEVYNRLSSRGGPIASILDEAARKLADGGNAGEVKSDAYSRVRAEISQTLGGGLESGNRRPEGTPEGEPDTGTTLFSPETELAPPFYSKAARVAFEKLPSSGSSESMLATLKNAGVKADEIKWMGLDDFLKDKPKATKAEVLSYIMKNMVQVREISKGTANTERLDELNDRRESIIADLTYNQGYGVDQRGDHYDVALTDHAGNEAWAKYGSERYDALPQAVRDKLDALSTIDRQMRLEHQRNENKTKYDSYTLPGEKKNYTELLLTLPTKPGIAGPKGWGDTAGGTSDTANFRSGHFDEPNILAHVRFDERTDADGKPILFVEEVQSDWHQKGKKVGYKTDDTVTTKAERDESFKKFAALARKDDLGGHETVAAAAHDVRAILRGEPGNEYSPETIAAGREYWRLRDMEDRGKIGVPNAPFKSDWHELAMKTMLRKAAEGGYDKLGWVTGQQTAERYDLSKSIQSIGYVPFTGDKSEFTLTAVTSDGRHIDLGTKKASELSGVVGKDIAEKITKGEGEGDGAHKVLSGLDLKTGGEWAKNLYDRAIPNFLSKYGKKWGATVADAQIVIGASFGENERLAFDGPTPTLAQVVTTARDDRHSVTVRNHLEYIAMDMRRGLSFAEALDKHGSPAAAEALGGRGRFVAEKDETTIHSLSVTPEMRASVLSEGQPLFSPAARELTPKSARNIEFSVIPSKGRVPLQLRVNRDALRFVATAVGHAGFNGVNLDPGDVPQIQKDLETIAGTFRVADGSRINDLAKALGKANHRTDGVVLVPADDSARGLIAQLEEQFHAAVQRRPGGGNIGRGVPWREMQDDPGLAKMSKRLHLEHGAEHGELVHVAEGMADIFVGTAPELSAEEVEATATRYYEALADAHGTEPLEAAAELYSYIDQKAASVGIIKPGERFNAAATTPSRSALVRVLGRRRETPGGGSGVQTRSGPGESGSRAPSGLESKHVPPLARGPETIPGSPSNVRTDGERTPLAGSDVGRQPLRLGEVHERPEAAQGGQSLREKQNGGELEGGPARSGSSASARPRESWRSRLPAERTATSLHSTQPIGLTDEELEDWSKAKGFRVEEAGEQPGLFGGSDPVMRVFRAGRGGKEQKALVYQSQLDQLHQPKTEPTEPFALIGGESREQQPTLFGAGDLGEIVGNPKAAPGIQLPGGENGRDKGSSLFSSESGEARPGELAKTVAEAAGAVGDYLREVKHATDLARDLQRNLETLDTAKQADILRGVKTMQQMKSAGFSKADDAALYHHLEDPSGVELKGKQDQWLDDTILPIQEQNEELYKELTDGGVPIENYVHRVVKGKGGMLDRIAKDVRGVGPKGTLSKSAPQTKSRTYMALEDRDGKRMVVSVKGGQVTAWDHGTPENLGGISKTDEGQVFEAKDGTIWHLRQATTKEIEQHTETEYYHSALASSIASNIQLNSAVRAMRFLEAYKGSPEFKEIAWKGPGNPPQGWHPTKLQQFAGYYFEPRTAEVLDDYYDRMRNGQFGVLQSIQKFLRAAYLINPIVHPLNVAASAAFEKGLSGFAPWKWKTIYKTGNKAIKAVLEKNQDFLDALDAGGALQSHRDAMQEIHKLFFERLAEGLDKKESWAMDAAKALGIEHGNLLNLLHKPSSTAAWTASDVMYLQAAYQYQSEHPGVTLGAAFQEVGRIIPEYRLPSRIADSRLAAKAMGHPMISWFGAYHYGLLKSFAEAAKSALGAADPPNSKPGGEPGRGKAQDIAKGWDRLALLGLVTMALFPFVFDKKAQKLTGDEHARWRRPGPLGYVDSAEQVLEHKQDASSAAEKVLTFSPLTKTALEAFFNHDFFSGHQIRDPHADWGTQVGQLGRFLMGEFGIPGQIFKSETSEQKRRLRWQQAGVQFGKSRAEKIAGDIAASKVGTEAELPEDHENRVQRREVLDQLRKGNSKPFEEARAKHQLSHRQILDIQHRARLQPLEDTVHNFTVAEVQRVLDAAKADKDQKEVDLLEKILRQKRARTHSWQGERVLAAQ